MTKTRDDALEAVIRILRPLAKEDRDLVLRTAAEWLRHSETRVEMPASLADLFIRATNCVRILRALTNANVLTIQDLTSLTRENLMRLNNIGPRSRSEIENALASVGLALAEKPSPRWNGKKLTESSDG